MFRGLNSDGLCSKEAAAAAPVVPAAHAASGVSSLGQGGQESPWLGLLSAVSRPAVSFLHRCLPERLRSPASVGGLFGGLADELTRSVDADGAFLGPHLPFLRPRHEPAVDASPPGYLAMAKNFLAHMLSGSPGREAPRVKSAWWPEIWASEGASHAWRSHLPRQAGAGAVSVSMPTEPSVERALRASMLGERAGASCHNRRPRDGSAHVVRPESFPSSVQPPSELRAAPAAVASAVTSCRSEVAALTPDQDNGYSSLEEEQSGSRSHAVRPRSLGEGSMEASGLIEEQACRPDGGLNGLSLPGLAAGGAGRGTEESRDSDADSEEGEPPSQEEPGLETETEPETQAVPFLSTPKCQNKAIAYIMGSPCSEESGTESEGDRDWDSSTGGDDDDDGFDSEGASDFSDSDDLDEEDSEADCEADAEVERLCSRDPYNPRNFTATLCTASKPSPGANACVLSAEVECPPPPPPPCTLSSPSCSPRPLTVEDESEEEMSNVLDADSLQLWNSFSFLSDPYSPLNFQAPLRTRHAAQGPPPVSSFTQRKEAEERMDSGFSEDVSLSEPRCAKLKKVRFVEEVEEFYASGDEDRRGPWEEFARDRCRFLRRVQETEEVISYCLAPTFRLLIFQRLYQSC